MAYLRPTFSQLKTRIEADLAALTAPLREAFAVAWSQAVHSLHGHLEWIDQQCSPLTCTLERLYDWAALYAVTRLDAVAAAGNVIATGNLGAIVLADSLLRADNGLDYKVTNAVTLGAGNTLINVRCTTAGVASNLIAGQVLTLVDPLAGVTNTMTVDAAGITGGAAQEDVDAWRLRVVDEWRVVVSQGARSGRVDDYKAWAKAAHPDVTTALVQLNTLGIGTVLVRPICNGLANRLPSATIMSAIQTKLAQVAPATADWRVAAPLVRNVNVNIRLLPAVDNAQNRAAVTTAINNAILAEVSETSLLAMAELDAAIATVTTQYNRVAPTADIAVAAGEVLVLAGVVFS